MRDVTGGHKSVGTSGELVTVIEEADVVTIWSARRIPFLSSWTFEFSIVSYIQSKCFVGVKMSEFF